MTYIEIIQICCVCVCLFSMIINFGLVHLMDRVGKKVFKKMNEDIIVKKIERSAGMKICYRAGTDNLIVDYDTRVYRYYPTGSYIPLKEIASCDIHIDTNQNSLDYLLDYAKKEMKEI